MLCEPRPGLQQDHCEHLYVCGDHSTGIYIFLQLVTVIQYTNHSYDCVFKHTCTHTHTHTHTHTRTRTHARTHTHTHARTHTHTHTHTLSLCISSLSFVTYLSPSLSSETDHVLYRHCVYLSSTFSKFKFYFSLILPLNFIQFQIYKHGTGYIIMNNFNHYRCKIK